MSDRTIGSIFHLWFQTRAAISTMPDLSPLEAPLASGGPGLCPEPRSISEKDERRSWARLISPKRQRQRQGDGFEAIPVFRSAVQHPRETGRVSRRWRKARRKGGDCDRSRHGPPRLHEKTEPESAGEREPSRSIARVRLSMTVTSKPSRAASTAE